jgi:hypothetical protein
MRVLRTHEVEETVETLKGVAVKLYIQKMCRLVKAVVFAIQNINMAAERMCLTIGSQQAE